MNIDIPSLLKTAASCIALIMSAQNIMRSASGSLPVSEKQQVWLNSVGALEFDGLSFTLSPGLHTMNWGHVASKFEANADLCTANMKFAMKIPNSGGIIDGTVAGASSPDEILCRYTFAARQKMRLNMLGLTSKVPVERLAGRRWKIDETSGIFPRKLAKPHLYAGPAKNLTLSFDTVDITFTFLDDDTTVLLQDNRQFGGDTFTVRIGRNAAATYIAGKPVATEFAIKTSKPFSFARDTPFKLAAGADWEPLDLSLEIEPGSALDFSEMGWLDAPAGKHGRVRANGPHFEFEKTPGKPQRFYGVNFCFDANIPDNALAGRIAERLMRLGYNSVRIHHYENALTRDSAKSTELNPDAMARFDYFMAALIKRGIYLATDLYVSRSVPWREIGVDRDGTVPKDTFKSLVYVHEGARKNQMEFVRNLLTHINPHTGRCYAEEPALAWIVIINEGNHFNHPDLLRRSEWLAEWEKWIAAKHADPDFAGLPGTLPERLQGSGKHIAALQIFLAEKEVLFMNEWRTFIRETLKCRALLSNTNGWTQRISDQLARAQTYDYVDDHFYIDHPRFLGRRWQLPSSCPNQNPIRSGATGGFDCAYLRFLDRPFTVSEYNYSAPGMYRGVGGILTGALASRQDWGGLWRFAYSHNDKMGEPARLGYFDMLGDPLGQAAERASLCLFIRRDVPVHETTVAIIYPEASLRIPGEKAFVSPAPRMWRDMAHKAKVGVRVTTAAAATTGKNEIAITYPESHGETRPRLPPQTAHSPVSIDASRGVMTIASGQTCGGFAERGACEAGSLRFDVGDVPATVWISALDKLPIPRSRRLLLTHLTDVQNTGMRYGNRGRNILLDWGRLPHLVRVGVAKIEIRITQPESYVVYALNTAGKRIAKVPARSREGILEFAADVAGGRAPGTPESARGARMLYEIVQK